MVSLRQYEPRVFNDMEEVVHGREEKWAAIQRRKAHWTTRGGYLENCKGSRQDAIAKLIAFAIVMLMIGAIIGTAWFMTR